MKALHVSFSLVIAICSLFLLCACSDSPNDGNDQSSLKEQKVLYTTNPNDPFEQLFDNNINHLEDYDLVEVGIGSLDFIDTSLVYSNAQIQDIDQSALDQGTINACTVSGPGSGIIQLCGFAKLDAKDPAANTITISEYGPNIEKATNSDHLTLSMAKRPFVLGEASFDDVSVDNRIAFTFDVSNDGGFSNGAIWATDGNKAIRLIDHQNTFSNHSQSQTDSTLPLNRIFVNKENLKTFDEAHTINGVKVEDVNPSLFREGIFDSSAFDGPQQVILYGYAHVDSISDNTVTVSDFGSNIKAIIKVDSLDLIIPDKSDHLFDGETTVTQLKANDDVVIQLVLGLGGNNLSSGNVWLTDAHGNVALQ